MAAVWLLLGLANASVCPQYSCQSLASNVCCEYVSGQEFALNLQVCQSDYYCASAEVSSWAQSPGSQTATFSCTASAPTYPSAISTCPTKLQNKNFASGAAVVTCTSASDCVLEDYTLQTCNCGFRSDGQGVCEPHSSNTDVYSGFWAECGPENTITDASIGLYWALYMQQWVSLQGAVSCTNVFNDMQKLAELAVNHAIVVSLYSLVAV